MAPRGTATFSQHFLHVAPRHTVMGHGDLQMKNDVRGFTGDFFSIVVFAGHDELGAFFADFFENAVVAAFKQFVGVTALLGIVLASSIVLNSSVQTSAGGGRAFSPPVLRSSVSSKKQLREPV